MGIHLGIPGFGPAEEIGRGGFGVVYRCEEEMFDRTIAIKVLRGVAGDAAARRRFDGECRAMGTLSDHPHIVTVYGGGMLPTGDAYIVMDYLPNGSLADVVARSGPVHVCHVLEVGVMLAGALESAHRAGLLHRDIKPENVLVSDYGEAELADFGIALAAGTGTGTAPTAEDRASATIVHMAPEALMDGPSSVATDLYAFGSTLYHLLTGDLAFVRPGDTSLAQIRDRIAAEPVPDMRARHVDPAMADVVEQLMAKDPGARPSSAAEVGQTLRSLQARMGYDRTPLRIAPDATTAAVARAAGASPA